jgi:hypothetical protein
MRLHRVVTSALVPACLLFLGCAQQGEGGGSGGSSSGGSTGSGGSGTGGSATGGNGSGGSATGGNGSGGNGSGGSATGGNGSGGNGSGGSATGGNGSGGTVSSSGGAAGKGSGGAAGSGTASGGAAGKGAGGSGSGGTAGAGTGSGGANGGSTGSSGPVYNPNFVEFYGSDCTVATPKDVSISGQLPNLFTKFDGTTMSKRSDWKCRRAEMKAVVEKYILGAKPGAPTLVSGSVSSTQIKVHAEGGGKSIDFSVPITLPSGAKGPVPIIIGLSGFSLDKGIVTGEGVAWGTYDNNSMDSETARTGLFTTINGSNGVSAQVGWAWGFSRIIDVLISEKAAGRNNIIDPTAVAVTGCSRDGKGAFTVGAFDERIALGIPQESGTGGVSAMRIVNTQPVGPNGNPAQSLSSAWSTAQGWFETSFQTYTSGNKVDTIPGDTHSLAAMHAPRGLLVLDNSRIGELCASCQHAATDAAQVVYQALGIGANVGYNGGNPTDPQNHCSFYTATQGPPLQRAIRAHLTKTAAPDGRMEPQPAGTADLTKWVPWSSTAPTLTNDVSWSSPPLTSQ